MDNKEIKKAAEFAAEKHKDQTYGEGVAYTRHLNDVSNVLTRFNITDEYMHVAAWLHDVVEDTQTPISEVDAEFGLTVGSLVWAVTNESGKNRKERNEKTYVKIAGLDTAVALKLAD